MAGRDAGYGRGVSTAAPLGVAGSAAVAGAHAGRRPAPAGRARASWAYDPARHDLDEE